MAATSSIPAVIDKLVEILTGLPECEGFTVSDGFPVNQPFDIVVVGGTSNATAAGNQEHRTLGRSGAVKRESYNVELTVSVYRGGANSQKLVRDRAFAAVAGLENAIAADPSLGGLVRIASVDTLSLQQTDAETAAQGRLAEVAVQVHVENDLRL